MSTFVTGAHGMVGTALRARLATVRTDFLAPRSADLDLRDAAAIDAFFDAHPEIDTVIHLAARSGGLGARLADPVGFLTDNMRIALQPIEAAARRRIPRLIYIGSACVYPLDAPQPIREDAMFSGPIEAGNEGYGLAKACATRLCAMVSKQYGLGYFALQPCNMIGPHDRFDPARAQVVPSLLARFHRAVLDEAPRVEVWGSGNARREFLFADDLVEAILHFIQHPPPHSSINVGFGTDVSIRELVAEIVELTGYTGEVVFDVSKPEGAPRRLLDSSRAHALGWKAQSPLGEALAKTYAWFRENHATMVPMQDSAP